MILRSYRNFVRHHTVGSDVNSPLYKRPPVTRPCRIERMTKGVGWTYQLRLS